MDWLAKMKTAVPMEATRASSMSSDMMGEIPLLTRLNDSIQHGTGYKIFLHEVRRTVLRSDLHRLAQRYAWLVCLVRVRYEEFY